MSRCTGQSSTASFTIGQIVRQFGAGFVDQYRPNYRIQKVLNDIGNCRTAALGGHFVKCEECDYEKKVYNSCGNSNCSQCQHIKRELWIDKMVHHLLPIKHFHIIFTVPHQLNDLFFYNQRKMYGLFFSSAWETIKQVTGKGLSGMVSTLHTWGSNLSYHPHLHCIVPKGSLLDGKWEMGQLHNARFFVKVQVLRETFKAVFLKNLIRLIDHDVLYFEGLSINDYTLQKIRSIYRKVEKIKKWSLRIEVPVCGIEQIVEYLGRYIKRVAITNGRLVDVNKASVLFSYNVYAKQKKGKPPPKGIKELEGAKFLQQFSQHILPRYFQRVRYYGIYAFSKKPQKQLAYQSITNQVLTPYTPPLKRQLVEKMLGTDPDVCPGCGCYNTLRLHPLLEELVERFRLGSRRVNPSIKSVRLIRLGQSRPPVKKNRI